MDKATAEQTAQALVTTARVHKRAAAHHRRSARRAMQELAELSAKCGRLGIHLELA